METRNNKIVPFFLWSCAGLTLLLVTGSRIAWRSWFLFSSSASLLPPRNDALLFLLLIMVSYGTASFLVWKYLRYPKVGRFPCLLFCSLAVWTGAVCLIAMFRLYYSRPFLLWGICFQLCWCFGGYRLFLDPSKLRFAVIPGGIAETLKATTLCRWEQLEQPRLPEGHYDGVVGDLHQEKISPEWVRFIAECSLKNIPLFHAATLYENLTGRVSLGHMGTELLQQMARPRTYSFFKHAFDVTAVLCSLPLSLPAFCLIALAVRLDMGAPILFRQERIGRFGKPFSIFKFRSLQNHEDGTLQPTRLGSFLRRHRLDELPQLLNILRGEMSLVGPRPEQTALVSRYEEAIPFYAFRAALRPGITGWAQVCWRYADNTRDNRIKLEHDIFYLKYFSFWLDLLILAKTFRTVLRGQGSAHKNPSPN